jgi:amidohydrolase
MQPAEAKQKVIRRIDQISDQLWEISTRLYQNPEIAFQEVESAALIAAYLAEGGFEVETGTGGLETAFQATWNGKSDTPVIAFLCEYDALPEIGHACGHNLIASMAIGAGMGAAALTDDLPGQIRVIGTPAEERSGGKRIMVEAGVFEGIDAAMMVHPASKNMIRRGSLASMRLHVEFIGKTSHAAASPQEGINALDAMILTFNGINALRQHLKIKDRVAGIITNGGEAANIIPGYTAAEFSVRGENEARRDRVVEKVIACADGAARATGCTLKYQAMPGYAEIFPNPTVSGLFAENVALLGRELTPPAAIEPMGSTDMGNVSKVVPAIHPYIATVPDDIAGHTVEFREACMTESGKSAMLDSAKAMAMTAVDLLLNPESLVQARAELETYLNNSG